MKLVRETLGKLWEVRRRKRLKTQCFQAFSMVEVTGFEPATFWSRRTVHVSDIVRLGPLLLGEKQDYAGLARTI